MIKNVTELKKMLVDKNIDPNRYSLSGGLLDDTLCISQTNAGWEVYYSERGKKWDVHYFSEQSEACQYLWRLIINED